MSTPDIQGHCLCGNVKYVVTKEPMWCGHCHCSDCRRFVASAVSTFLGCEKEFFRLTEGEFSAYESSPGVWRSFCSNCGTPMAYEADNRPGEIHILIGTLSHPEAYPPQLEVFCKEKLSWLDIRLEGPSFETLPE